ncbi:MAG: SPOR domain-containing protein [bacterium]
MKTFRSLVLLQCFLLTACFFAAPAQTTSAGQPDIQKRLELIEKGQGEAVKAELPTLLTNFQNHPGIMYLQALLTTDGVEAVKIYQSIVDNFPGSEWTDDALFKLYQYYYSIGLYKTADQKLEQLRRNFPYSSYASDQQVAEEPKETPKQNAKEPKKVEEPARETKKPAVQPAAKNAKGKKPLTPSSKTAKETQKPAKTESFSTSFTVQAGTFSVFQNAEELKARFEKEKYSTTIFTLMNNGRKFYKVWVGEFRTQDEAKKFSEQFKKKFKINAIVVSR